MSNEQPEPPFDLEAARHETFEQIAGCLRRLSKASKLLERTHRMALAELCRDVADAFDEGRVLSPTDKPKRRRFVATSLVGGDGRPLYREVCD